MWSALLLVTFLEQARKVTCRPATPANDSLPGENLNHSPKACFAPTFNWIAALRSQ
jgi:hypothetical protein